MVGNLANRASDRRRKKWRENKENTFPREPQPHVAQHPHPQMTSKNIEIWGGALSIELPAAAPSPSVMPTPGYAIGQTVLFANLKQLTFLTERSIPPPRRVWLYKYFPCNSWVPEAYFQPVAQDIPFDDFMQGARDWIPLDMQRAPFDPEEQTDAPHDKPLPEVA